MKILLVDDHAIVRKGIAEILASPGTTVEEASTADEASDMIAAGSYDILILDLALQGEMSGFDLMRVIKANKIRLPVLVLTMFPGEQYAMRCYALGASGYLTKDVLPEELRTAIDVVANGGKYISAELSEILSSNLPVTAPAAKLSTREFQVARRIACGKTVGQIAVETGLSVNTVSTYRTRLLSKLALSTNAELTVYMIRNGLAE